jgi:RNA polymerase sigma-70 factor (ECF subfamily)
MLEAEETQALAAANAGNQEAFHHLTEPYRRELLVHCYRLLGSMEDAEDLLQETLLRAWQRLDTFVRHVSFRAWLYKIATNACLNALAKRPRRILPESSYPPGDPSQPQAPPVAEPIWLQPFPDEWLPEIVAGATSDPEAHYTRRESISLAFVLALQLLPARQRAVLILRDVLDWQAKETAELLGLTVSSVNSALHRARETLAKSQAAGARERGPILLEDQATRNLLQLYVQAMENADVAGMIALLKEDATFTMPPIPTWYRGHASIQALLTYMLFAGEAAGRWRLLPAHANLQPAFGLYQRDETNGTYQPYALQVLTLVGEAGQISEIINFLGSSMFAQFGLPAEL